MTGSTWNESVIALRKVAKSQLKFNPSLLILDSQIRWKNVNIKDFKIMPIRETLTPIIGQTTTFTCQSPYSNLIVIDCDQEEPIDYAKYLSPDSNIGIAMSAILSFIMRSTVIAFNGFPPLQKRDGSFLLNLTDEFDVIWNKIFRNQEGLQGRSANRMYEIPSPHEEQVLMETFSQFYAKLMSMEEKEYELVMGALHLYQLAYFVSRNDLSLSYSLLVAAIDAICRCQKANAKLADMDPEGKLVKTMEEIGLETGIQKTVLRDVNKELSLTKKFSNFIIQYLPATFWNGDYSYIAEIEKNRETSFNGQRDRDLSEYAPEGIKQKLLSIADDWQKSWEKSKEELSKKDPSRFFDIEKRKMGLAYLQSNFPKVLSNTYHCRSQLFHCGIGFPKTALTNDFRDWIPDIFEEDYQETRYDHLLHNVEYKLCPNGKINRLCSCGEKKEILVILDVRVFERIVHDCILNYILPTN